ncbi:MAG: hypothetical protein JKP95_01795 [Oceanicaulis sp.]|nr:hypothetical protein [Oceanicaulis sp.]
MARFYRAGRTVQLTVRAGAAGMLVDQVRRGALDLVAADMGDAVLDPDLVVHPLPEESVTALVRPDHPALKGEAYDRFPLATATPPERLSRQPLPWGRPRPVSCVMITPFCVGVFSVRPYPRCAALGCGPADGRTRPGPADSLITGSGGAARSDLSRQRAAQRRPPASV